MSSGRRPGALRLYYENAKSIFWNGYSKNGLTSSSYGTPIRWLFHTICLPASMIAGAGIKTIIDVNTREELTEAEIKTLKDHLNQLDNEKFDAAVIEILQYDPSSELSIALKDTLQAANKKEEEQLFELHQLLQAEMQEKIGEDLKTQARKKLGKNLAYYIDVSAKPDIKLNDEELKQITTKFKELSQPFIAEKRRIQEEAILAYIDNNLNAGKKMERVVYDSVELEYRVNC